MASNVPAIATHPDRAQIEIGLANGVSLRALGKRYGLQPSQLSRYRKNHMSEELVARLRVRGLRSDEELAEVREAESKSLLDHLVYQRARCYAVADRAREIKHDDAELRAIESAGRASERIGKLLGEMGAVINNTTNNLHVNLTSSPDYHVLRTQLIRALRPYPEAQTAVAHALAHLEGGDEPRTIEGVRVG